MPGFTKIIPNSQSEPDIWEKAPHQLDNWGDRGHILNCALRLLKCGEIIMTAKSDTERFARYQAVVEALIAKNPFRKSEIYPSFKTDDKAFIGRVISELTLDGYLMETGRSKIHPFPGQRRKEISIRVAGLTSVSLRQR